MAVVTIHTSENILASVKHGIPLWLLDWTLEVMIMIELEVASHSPRIGLSSSSTHQYYASHTCDTLSVGTYPCGFNDSFVYSFSGCSLVKHCKEFLILVGEYCR